MTDTLSVKYYLAHETPDGMRYAYPVAGFDLLKSAARRHGLPNTRFQVSVLPEGTRHSVVDKWLITDAPLVGLRMESPGSRLRDGWEKRAALHGEHGPISPDMETFFQSAPERPEKTSVDHFEEHDAAHICWKCAAFSSVYQPRYVVGKPVVETEVAEGWSPLPGDLSPASPGRVWQVNDPSLLAVYGAHTAHLWPGRLSGVRKVVEERLRAHPLVSDFYDWHDSRSGQGFYGFSVVVRVPWETRRTKSEIYRPHGARKNRTRQVDDWAMKVKHMETVSDVVPGNTKAEALAKFDEVVERWCRRFLPFGDSPRACDRCEGLGWVNGDA